MKRIFLVLLIMTVFLTSCTPAKKTVNQTAKPTTLVTSNPTAVPTATAEPTPEATATPDVPLPTTPPGTGQYAGEINAAKKLKADFYPGGFANQQAAKIETNFAVQFFATTTFDSVSIAMPTWMQKEGHAATLTLYAWQGSYERTFLSEPLAQQDFENWSDGVEVILKFNELQDGEYLLEIYNDGTPNVGFWYKPETSENVRTYLADEEWTDGIPRLVVYYTKTPTNIMGPIQASGLE